MGEQKYDSWKEDMITDCIAIKQCPQCGATLKVNDNFYFPDRDTYICYLCDLAYTQITPGEIVITHRLEWDRKQRKFVKVV